eukprot:TRINITY_DN14109_c0_g2_i1.p2 TRINITY_DN14109_c0_g2~~TRINITY_DN14109_c0_g2_i1.p2  ORF type:complete len:193 (-),score=19.73 TRINITY_DN14109_c0_g2_i1:688-1266(-)
MANDSAPKIVKLFCDGMDSVGKTSLLITYTTNNFPVENVPAVLNAANADVILDENTTVSLQFWDFLQREDSDRLDPIAYTSTNIFLACFSIDNPKSLELLVNTRIHQYRHYWPAARILLVGTKCDLRQSASGVTCIPPEQAQEVVRNFELDGYMECSAMTQYNVREVFETAARLGLSPREYVQKQERSCMMM